jgi:hypothetical protein
MYVIQYLHSSASNDHSIQGSTIYAPLHRIPNVAIGKVQRRHITRIFFPNLYRENASPTIAADDLTTMYDHCLRPTIQAVTPAQLTHWPVSYAAAMAQSRGGRGILHFGSIDIPTYALAEFGTQFLERLEQHVAFQGAYFVHELRGSKGASAHDAGSANQRSASLDDVTAFIDMDIIDLDDWYVDVAMEVHVPGHVTHFAVSGFKKLLQLAMPNATTAQIEKLANSKKYFQLDRAASLKDVGGFRVTTKSCGRRDNVAYINVYCTEKSAIYQLFQGGLFRRHNAKELLPSNLSRLLGEIQKISEVFAACSGANATHDGLEGNARYEIRIPLQYALDRHYSFPQHVIRDSLLCYEVADWWYV